MTGRFADALTSRPLLLDAAMGTRLIDRGLDLARDDPSTWTLDRPDEVLTLHRLDILAGSDALLTNTFGANRAWLARSGRADHAIAINSRAVEIARRAAGPDRLVLGSIGPTASDDPLALLEQARALAGAGVDALLLETHRHDQAMKALSLLRPIGLPLLASLHAWPANLDHAARDLAEAGAVAIGANCLTGMAPALEIARRLRSATGLPLLLKPAAGLSGATVEPPEAFEHAAPGLLALGVRLLGGCCGATDAHVAALRRAMTAAGIATGPPP